MAENNVKNTGKKTLIQMNGSWLLMFVYLAYMVGIYFFQSWTIRAYAPASANSYLYLFLTLIVGIVVTFLVYNGGKIIAARIAGYHINGIKCLGLVGRWNGEKLKFGFDFLSILDFYLSFAPKDDDVKRKPRLIFLGGFIAEVLLAAVALVLFFIFGFNGRDNSTTASIGYQSLVALLYGFVMVLYELMPFRQDYPNDMFNLITTRKEEDRIAYNIVKINEKREFTGEEFIVPEFTNYASYYKSQTLVYLYFSQLYKGELEDAVKTLNSFKTVENDLPDEKKCFKDREYIYFRFLTGDQNAADRTFSNLKADYRKIVRKPYYLSDYRTGIIVNCTIARGDKEGIDEIFKNRKELRNSLADSNRVKKEDELFRQVYDLIKKNHPDQYLPSID